MKRMKMFQKLNQGFQVAIDADTYANPYSTMHPDTGMHSAYNLYRLIDNIPVMGSSYMNTIYSFSKTYSNIINFGKPQNSMSKMNFMEAKELLDCDRIARLTAFSHEFYLIETIPYRFWDYQGMKVELNLSPDYSDGEHFISLAVKQDTTVVYEDAQIVEIHRPWFMPEIFLSTQWSVNGYDADEISDGTASTGNGGILPLIPTHMVLSKVVGDQHYDYPFLVGIISDVVPKSPVMNAQMTINFAKTADEGENSLGDATNYWKTNEKSYFGKVKLLEEQDS